VVEIRSVRPDEYEAAGRVTADAYREFVPPNDPDWDRYLAELADVGGRVDRTEVYVAVEDGVVRGCVTLELDRTVGDDDAELPRDVSCIRMLGVDPSARRNGYGRALIQYCIDRSRAAGKRLVILRTTDLMKAAQMLYLSMGFERDEERDMVFENGFRLIAYRLPLS
jgi:GNAT superfamily N-acetyltransferase